MRLFAIIAMVLCLTGCKALFEKPTKTWAAQLGMGISHSPSVATPPEVHMTQKEESLPVPAGSKVTRTEVAATEDKPATTTTVIELPKNKGMDLSITDTKTDMVGSKGFEPPKPPTPTEKSNAWWTYIGIGMVALGGFFCTPWGGTNWRVGGIIAGFGIGMALIGKFLDKLTIPAPSLFLFGILLALGVYYGYKVRNKQLNQSGKQSE